MAKITSGYKIRQVLDSAPPTTAELDLLNGVTATTAEINILSTITATANEINRAADISTRIVNITTETVLITQTAYDGRVMTLNRAAGIAVTLPPASGTGVHLRFVVGTTVTSSTTTIKVVGDDTMVGVAVMAQDAADTASVFEASGTDDTITLNGSTTGGIKGDFIELIDIAADLWYVRYTGSGTDTEATPFSATVT